MEVKPGKLPITFVVTGANRGIGLELCKQILQDNERNVVIGTVRSADKSAGLKSLQGQYLDRFHVLFCDIASSQSIQSFAVQVEAVLPGGLDYLINNAAQGASGWVPASQADGEDIKAVHNTNFVGTFLLTQALLPLLRLATRKTVVNITSATGTFAFTNWMAHKEGPHMGPVMLAYRTSKAALNLATILLAQDLRPDGFTIVAVHPGLVSTDLGQSALTLGVAPAQGSTEVYKAISPEISVKGILGVVEGLATHKSGCAFDWQGKPLEW